MTATISATTKLMSRLPPKKLKAKKSPPVMYTTYTHTRPAPFYSAPMRPDAMRNSAFSCFSYSSFSRRALFLCVTFSVLFAVRFLHHARGPRPLPSPGHQHRYSRPPSTHRNFRTHLATQRLH